MSGSLKRSRRRLVSISPVVTAQMPVRSLAPVVNAAAGASVTEKTFSNPRSIDWRSLSLAVLLAAGFSTMFLGQPLMRHFQQASVASGAGTVLGATTSKPLRVNVTVAGLGRTVATVVEPTSARLPEALAKAATGYHTTFSYTSTNQEIQLAEFFGQPSSAGGYWQVRVNGLVMADLNSQRLRQGDTIVVEWLPFQL